MAKGAPKHTTSTAKAWQKAQQSTAQGSGAGYLRTITPTIATYAPNHCSPHTTSQPHHQPEPEPEPEPHAAPRPQARAEGLRHCATSVRSAAARERPRHASASTHALHTTRRAGSHDARERVNPTP
eukprot:1234874-Rhodomonas_salina.1